MLELYHYSQPEQEKLLKSMTVLVDTREHKGKNNHILNYFDSKQIPLYLCQTLNILACLYWDIFIIIYEE